MIGSEPVVTSFPAAIWDGTSGNGFRRPGTDAPPDAEDYTRLVNEVIAAQTAIPILDGSVPELAATIVSGDGLSRTDNEPYSYAGTGGSVVIRGGNGGNNTGSSNYLYGGNGGSVVITGGTAGNGTIAQINNNGGVQLSTKDFVRTYATKAGHVHNGGPISLLCGVGTGADGAGLQAGEGGSIQISAGGAGYAKNGAEPNVGGHITIQSGLTGSVSGSTYTDGYITIIAGRGGDGFGSLREYGGTLSLDGYVLSNGAPIHTVLKTINVNCSQPGETTFGVCPTGFKVFVTGLIIHNIIVSSPATDALSFTIGANAGDLDDVFGLTTVSITSNNLYFYVPISLSGASPVAANETLKLNITSDVGGAIAAKFSIIGIIIRD